LVEGYDGLDYAYIAIDEVLIAMPAVDWFSSRGENEVVLEFGLPFL